MRDCDISQWLTELETVTEEIWNEDNYRQESFYVHKDTQTIPIVFDTSFSWPTRAIRTEHFHKYENCLTALESVLAADYGEGFTARVILTKLKGKGDIPEHRDNGECFNVSHRCHLPLITNDEVYFTVGTETITMAAGELWEINNNQRNHSVVNKSGEDRVHLIIDWEPFA